MRNTKHSIYTSLISLLLCISMLMGTTFAWFTDAVTSNGNVIQSGKLDAQMFWSDNFISADADGWNDAENQAVFTHNKWEPGYTDLKYVKIHNGGSLNFKWKLTVEADGPVTDLANVIDVYYVNPATNEITSLEGLTSAGTLTKVMSEKANSTGSLASGQSVIIAIAFHMQGSAGNEYKGKSLCDNGFSLKLLATQETGEFDSFGDDYDSEAEWDEGTKNFSASAPIASVPIVYGQTTATLNIGGDHGQSAVIPSGVKVADGATSLDLAINAVDSNDNLTLGEGESAVSMDVHIHGVAADNTQPMIVNLGAVLPLLLNETEVKLYHTENGTPVQMTRVASADDFSIHNQFTYNPATGEVSIYVATFSVFSAVKTSADVWDGKAVDISWYVDKAEVYTLTSAAQLAGFAKLVDNGVTFEGKTVKLDTDIDLNNKLFNPIGGGWAYNGGNTFNGTFDGGNHTIYNIYVNGWELDATGDTHTCTSKGAGLFSSIHNATIKNLAISGANMRVETTSIGVVVGCAQGQCTFENIIVTNAVLGNYQMRNGGIVGDIYVIADDNVPEGDYSHTFKNIVVDSTVTLCSMWGDFDTGNGGVIGGKYGSAKVLMQNVVVACKLDVFSDVTAAYQWYAYRRCGMLIGYTGQNSPKQATNAAADFLTCENVDVYYGDWTNYTYYQFSNQTDAEGNRLWYSNYPWVRAEESVYNGPFSNVRYGNPVIAGEKINTLELAEANKTGFAAITFNQLYGGGQGVYGTANHESGGVTTFESNKSATTIYVQNNLRWNELKLEYWYLNGSDRWTTIVEGITLESIKTEDGYDIYQIDLPAYAGVLKISDNNGNSTSEMLLASLTPGNTYTLNWTSVHQHVFTNVQCECGATEVSKWEIVTDASTLKAGDKIVIVASEYNHALSTNQKPNNRGAVEITKSNDDTITINEDVQVITLVTGTVDGTFGFYTGTSGYLYAASSSDNHLKTKSALDDNGSWKIAITNNTASIVAKGSNNRNVMQYNPNNGSPLFSCYATASQKAVAIYKQIRTIEIAHNCAEYQEGATCTRDATCRLCGEVIADTKLNHEYNSIEVSPTCTENGYIAEKCSRCGESNITEIIPTEGHSYTDSICSVCGHIVGITVSVIIADYATENNWENGTKYTELDMDENIIVTVGGGSNSGKYFTDGNNWRLYESASSTVKFTANSDKILAIKFTYTSENSGVLLNGETQVLSGAVTVVKDNEITFSVGSGASETNGIVKITSIEVIYEANEHECDFSEATCNKPATCNICGATTGQLADHNYVDHDKNCTTNNRCSVCDDEENDSAKDHIFTDHDNNCTTDNVCSVCETTEVDSAKDHIFDDHDNDCTTDNICSVCGTTEVGSAKDHDFTDHDNDCTTDNVCSVCGTVKENSAKEHNYENGVCSVCGHVDQTTVTVNIADYANTNSWVNGTKYTTINMDSNITVTATGGGNTGKYYDSGYNWRIYQNESPSIKISATSGKTIVSVKITYTVTNTGVLTLNDSNIDSDTIVNVNASSVTFGVGNTGTETNGQVRITAIEVVYSNNGSNNEGGNEGGSTEPAHTCENVCGTCGKCTNIDCIEDVCAYKCEGHTTTPTTTTISKSHTDIASIAGVNTSGGSINNKEIKLDDNIYIVCAKGSSTSNPAIYDESIRLYQNGATLTIKGTGMTTIVITLAKDSAGDGPIAVTGGTVDNASAPTNYVYTITVDEGVSEVVITTKGTDKNSRLYVANIEVTYTE